MWARKIIFFTPLANTFVGYWQSYSIISVMFWLHKTDLISLLVCIMIFILVMGTTLCPRTHKPNGLCLWNCEHSSTVGVFMLLWWPAIMNAVRLPLQCYQHGQTNVLRHWSEAQEETCVSCVGIYAQLCMNCLFVEPEWLQVLRPSLM